MAKKPTSGGTPARLNIKTSSASAFSVDLGNHLAGTDQIALPDTYRLQAARDLRCHVDFGGFDPGPHDFELRYLSGDLADTEWGQVLLLKTADVQRQLGNEKRLGELEARFPEGTELP